MIKIVFYKLGELNETYLNDLSLDDVETKANELRSRGFIANIYGLPEVPTPIVRVRQGKKGENPKCSLCGIEAENDEHHPMFDCITNQLNQAKSEMSSLKDNVSFWKNAWYDQRNITGKLCWK